MGSLGIFENILECQLQKKWSGVYNAPVKKLNGALYTLRVIIFINGGKKGEL